MRVIASPSIPHPPPPPLLRQDPVQENCQSHHGCVLGFLLRRQREGERLLHRDYRPPSIPGDHLSKDKGAIPTSSTKGKRKTNQTNTRPGGRGGGGGQEIKNPQSPADRPSGEALRADTHTAILTAVDPSSPPACARGGSGDTAESSLQHPTPLAALRALFFPLTPPGAPAPQPRTASPGAPQRGGCTAMGGDAAVPT